MMERLIKSLKSDYSKFLNTLNLLLGLLVVIFVLILARDMLSLTYKKTSKAAPVIQTVPVSSKKSLQEYAPVVKNNPFGAPGGELRPLFSLAEKSAAPSDISGLTLVGTVSGSSRYGFAIFLDKSNNQEVFRVGETVHGYGRLERVEKDKVSIRVDNRLIDIQMADIIAITEGGSSRSGAGTANIAKSIGGGTYIVDQKKIQQAIEKPNQIMTDARLLPNNVDGKQQGFVLSEVKPGGIYQSLGLQNGDVLLRINDYNISNPENALQAFTALKGMDRIQLDIVRSGAKMTMTYQIK